MTLFLICQAMLSGSRRSFKNVATDILESHQALARNNSAMRDMSEEEKRAHILSMFKSADSWCMGTGTALPKTTITSEDTRGPGVLLVLPCNRSKVSNPC